MHVRRHIITAVMSAILSIGLLTTGASAATTPAPSPAQSVDATGNSAGLFSLEVHARRAANSPADSATGTFSARTGLLGLGVDLAKLNGPVTCLDVQGNRVGLFYPIRSSDPALLSQVGSGVFIYLEISASGTTKMVGFLPVPISSTKTCAPSLALFPFAGSVVLSS